MSVLSSLEPQEVFSFFDVLCTIPRGSGNEKQIAEWVVSFAQERGLEAVKDDLHCVLVRKPGQLGLENAAPLILHGHLDMVCEKEEGSTHNFETDSLRLLIDGDSITAEGTSLGADNGIGVSYILALLDSKEIPHPPIEAVLTAMEEKGKYGASQFDTSQLKGRRMIDFNWITDTEILAGCSGDVTFTIDLPANFEPVPAELNATRLVKVRGLVGGHCEFDIQLERANAILILARLLNAIGSRYDVRLSSPYGGAQNNAIPIDAEAVLSLRPEDVAGVEEIISDLGRALAVEYLRADPNIRLEVEQAPAPAQAFSKAATARFGQLTSLIPNGVISWSLQVPGIVETSNNLGTIRPTEDGARLMSTITSALTSRKHEVLDRIRALVALGGSDVTIEQFGLDAPEFPYQPDSALLAEAVKTYQEVIGTVPDIHVSQCSLELGMFSQKVPGLETISIGTELHDLHSPNESVNYKSVAKTWPLVRELVSRLS
jgi:dipeptidase D